MASQTATILNKLHMSCYLAQDNHVLSHMFSKVELLVLKWYPYFNWVNRNKGETDMARDKCGVFYT